MFDIMMSAHACSLLVLQWLMQIVLVHVQVVSTDLSVFPADKSMYSLSWGVWHVMSVVACIPCLLRLLNKVLFTFVNFGSFNSRSGLLFPNLTVSSNILLVRSRVWSFKPRRQSSVNDEYAACTTMVACIHSSVLVWQKSALKRLLL